jgi:hypothetical protein
MSSGSLKGLSTSPDAAAEDQKAELLVLRAEMDEYINWTLTDARYHLVMTLIDAKIRRAWWLE